MNRTVVNKEPEGVSSVLLKLNHEEGKSAKKLVGIGGFGSSGEGGHGYIFPAWGRKGGCNLNVLARVELKKCG